MDRNVHTAVFTVAPDWKQLSVYQECNIMCAPAHAHTHIFYDLFIQMRNGILVKTNKVELYKCVKEATCAHIHTSMFHFYKAQQTSIMKL